MHKTKRPGTTGEMYRRVRDEGGDFGDNISDAWFAGGVVWLGSKLMLGFTVCG